MRMLKMKPQIFIELLIYDDSKCFLQTKSFNMTNLEIKPAQTNKYLLPIKYTFQNKFLKQNKFIVTFFHFPTSHSISMKVFLTFLFLLIIPPFYKHHINLSSRSNNNTQDTFKSCQFHRIIFQDKKNL
jgi:hypothetical protein